jgi:NitT/TauT family transport system substrate-binding protein
MKRVLMFTVIVILVCSSLTYARTYKIAVVPWVGWSPMHVADAKGFWKEQGIDVKLFNVSSNQAIHTALKKKRIDIGFDMIGTAVGLYLEGLPVTVIAETDWSHGGDKIIAKQGLDAAALKGKSLGVYLNQPSVNYFLNSYLSTLGVQLSDVRIIEMETSILADKFIDGLFNVIVSYDPDALRAEREGSGRVVATSSSYEGCIPEGMMVLNEVLQDIPQEDLAKIFKGWVKAAEWTQVPANWKEYMEILNNHTFKGDAPYSEEDLKDMVSAVRIHNANALLERNRDNGGLYAYLNALKAFLASNDMLKREFTPEEIFNNTVFVDILSEHQ